MVTGDTLNKIWKVGAKHALYRHSGDWYHPLRDFPGALFDANGYVLFQNRDEYLSSPYLQIQNDVHVPGGISQMPGYVRKRDDDMENTSAQENWFEDYADQSQEFQIDEYDLTQTPNDFNVTTIFSFIESGSVKIPGFQRHYVWDLARASKLVESLILGLPVPQLFLYEEGRNSFLVIDGQQRLMSIYYFIKQRFPRKEKRAELRNVFDREGKIPDAILADDALFQPFRLKLPSQIPDQANKFDKKTYSGLADYKSRFDLRPIRNVIVKQNAPKDDDSSIYEIFNRLNSGGVNLRPQEIRTSLYHSGFYEMLYRVNGLAGWRRILGMPGPDLHNKDIEILLRGFAMLVDADNYAPSMVRFLNRFSKKCRQQSEEQNEYLAKLFQSFIAACEDLPDTAFINPGNNRFSISLYEAVFTAACAVAFGNREEVKGRLKEGDIDELESDKVFIEASTFGTTAASNVRDRLSRAKQLVKLY
jgi:uncharacterized protein with ParB-like and HNH nuclease domain